MPAKEGDQTCLRCGRKYEKKHSYCAACGAPVVNKCLGEGHLLGEPCDHVNPPHASYCTKCGSVTAFNRSGLRPASAAESKVLEKDEMMEMNWFSHPFFND